MNRLTILVSLAASIGQRTLWLLAAGLLIGATAVPVHAGVILSDDFSTGNGGGTSAGTLVDGTKWDITAGDGPLGVLAANPSEIDGAGHALVTASPSQNALASQPSLYTAVGTGEIQLTTVFTDPFETYGSFGLSDFTHYIILRSDVAVGDIYIGIQGDNGHPVSYYHVAGMTTAASAGTWVIDWKASEVVISHNSSVVLDTSLTNPTSGYTTAWDIPTDALGPYVFHYNGGLTPTTTVDSVLFETVDVPEPASLSLLGVGAILCLRRRRTGCQR